MYTVIFFAKRGKLWMRLTSARHCIAHFEADGIYDVNGGLNISEIN